jgi:hypothetical protein
VIARRYTENLESSVILAEDYNVNQRTIRKALIEEGVAIRDRAEAGRLRHQQRKAASEPQDAA